MHFYLYTDGSCIGNPGPGGWAFVLLKKSDDGLAVIVKDSGGDKDTTNNRMEMMAMIRGCEKFYSYEDRLLANFELKIYSDSQLLINTMNQNWKRKKNTDLWAVFDEVIYKLKQKGIKISFNWVKAHNGDKYNEMVDSMALKEAQKVRAKAN